MEKNSLDAEPLSRISLVETVANRIQGLIEQNKLRSGDALPTEPELITSLGVSRTVLREAVVRLQTMGMLTIQRGRGTFVGDRQSLASCAKLVRTAMVITPQDWVQFAEFRAAIEVQAMWLAAQRVTPEDLAELEEILADMDNPKHSYLESVKIDFDFHARIIDISGNGLLRNSFEVIREFILAGMVRTTAEPRDHSGSTRFHRKLLDALRTRDTEIAVKAIREHMIDVDRAMRNPPRSPQPSNVEHQGVKS